MDECDLLTERAVQCSEEGKFEEAIALLETSVKIYQEQRNNEKAVASLSYASQCWEMLGKNYEALESYKQCLPIIENYDINPKLKGLVYLGLGDCSNNIHQYQDSQKYLKNALEIAKQLGDQGLECKCCCKAFIRAY